jgi:hypothetical protein
LPYSTNTWLRRNTVLSPLAYILKSSPFQECFRNPAREGRAGPASRSVTLPGGVFLPPSAWAVRGCCRRAFFRRVFLPPV